MEDIVYEIIGGALILGIILGVIMVFRNGSDAVRESANSQMQSDVKIEQTIAVTGGVYGASKIDEAMKYAAVADMPTQVIIQNLSWVPLADGSNKTATGLSFNPDAAAYSNKGYTCHILYYSQYLPITTVENDDYKINSSNHSNVALVRYIFVENNI